MSPVPRFESFQPIWGIGCGSESWMSHHVLALGSKDLKCFVENQSQLWENRATSNPTTVWCSTFGSGILIRFISQSMSSQRSDSVSEGVRSPP
jgi:hypothetical protein